MSSGELMLWHPLSRREAARGLSPGIAGGGEGSALCVKWRPDPAPGSICVAVAGTSGRLVLYSRKPDEPSSPARESPKRSGSARGAAALKREATATLSRATERGFASAGVVQVSQSGVAVVALAFSADGTRLAAVTADGHIVAYAIGSANGGAPAAATARLSQGGSSAASNGLAGGVGSSDSPTCCGSVSSGSPVTSSPGAERLSLLFRLRSYFGGLHCVAWSGNGHWLVAGGEDDLISIVCAEQRALVGRAKGHRSWVRQLAFQPQPTPRDADAKAGADPATYTFASVGADGLLCFWEFQPKDLLGVLPDPPGATNAEGAGAAQAVAAPGFRAVPLIAPLSTTAVHPQPVSGLLYGRSVLLTACASGYLRTFSRVRA